MKGKCWPLIGKRKGWTGDGKGKCISGLDDNQWPIFPGQSQPNAGMPNLPYEYLSSLNGAAAGYGDGWGWHGECSSKVGTSGMEEETGGA